MARDLLEVCQQLVAEGPTMNIVEQNLRAALHLANRVYVVNNGQIAKARLPTSTLTRELPKDTSGVDMPATPLRRSRQRRFGHNRAIAMVMQFLRQKGSLYVVRASDSEAASWRPRTHGGGCHE